MDKINLLYLVVIFKKIALVVLLLIGFPLYNQSVLVENRKFKPVKNPLLTQRFSTNHRGFDIIDRFNNKEVYSITRCKIIDKGHTGNKSPYITCYDFNTKKFYRYIHITSLFEKNQILDAGDIIGKYNNEGNAIGYHLHLEVYDLQNIFDKECDCL